MPRVKRHYHRSPGERSSGEEGFVISLFVLVVLVVGGIYLYNRLSVHWEVPLLMGIIFVVFIVARVTEYIRKRKRSE